MGKHDFYEIYSENLPDKRIAKRVSKTLNLMIEKGTCVVNKLISSHTEKTGIYRMLSNERFNHDDLLEASIRKCGEIIDTDHVLVIQDTTEFNYQGIKSKLKKSGDEHIGPTSMEAVAGYFCHPGLVVDPKNDTLYGLSSVKIYNRSWDKKKKNEREYKRLAIEEKESYRWIETAENSKQTIRETTRITVVGDRESDIYEEFLRVPDKRTDVLVRAKSNRILIGEDQKLFEYLGTLPLKSEYDLEVKGKVTRKERIAKMEVRYSPVEIAPPGNFKTETQSVKLYAVEVKENESTVPKKEKAIVWRLLTTHKIETAEQAVECVSWYKKRWLIEELFRVLKTKGFKIESSQLGSGAGLKKLLALTLEAALKVMALKLSLTQDLKRAANVLFEEDEIELLEKLNEKIGGPTLKQKNPYEEKTLAWCAWVIARLGGWSGYISQGPPGYITIKDGYDNFNLQLQGFLLFKHPIKNVYKD